MGKKAKSGRGKIVGWSVALGVLTLLFVFLCVWFYGASYPEYDGLARREAPIPGLGDGISPQGLTATGDETYPYAMSGYISGGDSRVYLFGESGSKYITVERGGTKLKTHFGGIACTGNYLVIASGSLLVRVPLREALAAENGASVAIADAFYTDLQNAYCYFSDGVIYAGEFYRAGNYETPDSHLFQDRETGEVHRALVYFYEADEAAAGGVKGSSPHLLENGEEEEGVYTAKPKGAISVGDEVQGFAIEGDKIVLSCSYGLPDSRILVYENPLGGEPMIRGNTLSSPVDVFWIGEKQLRKKLTAPCMSEEIFLEGDRLYVLYESYSVKYRFFVRRRIVDVVSLPMSGLCPAAAETP